eukprot:m51a1_g4783 putative fumarate hydratase (412) ;mRNA; f:57369-58718
MARLVRDSNSIGEVSVPSWALYGPHTRRGELMFAAGAERLPLDVLRSYATVKRACAVANKEFGLISPRVCDAICDACRMVESGEVGPEQWPGLSVFQTGSGTLLNMNVNEVLACIAGDALGECLHPNDVVNLSQSSNDTFSSVVHVSAALLASGHTLPGLARLERSLRWCAGRFRGVVKPGRTHHMDALPVELSHEFSAYASQVARAASELRRAVEGPLMELSLGGTAVGTGQLAPVGFGARAVQEVATITGMPFRQAGDLFEQLSSAPAAVQTSSALKLAACSFLKMASDISWMASGPETGLREIRLPVNEAGSSIMPGKANPTQCEALAQVAVQVLANDCAVCTSASLGVLELNTFRPLICSNLMRSAALVDAADLARRSQCSTARSAEASKGIGYDAAAAAGAAPGAP